MLFLFEYQAKIIGGGKTAQLGNFQYGFIRECEHLTGVFDADLIQIIHYCHLQRVFENAAQVVLGNEKVFRNIVQTFNTGVVFVDVGQNITDGVCLNFFGAAPLQLQEQYAQLQGGLGLVSVGLEVV